MQKSGRPTDFMDGTGCFRWSFRRCFDRRVVLPWSTTRGGRRRCSRSDRCTYEAIGSRRCADVRFRGRRACFAPTVAVRSALGLLGLFGAGVLGPFCLSFADGLATDLPRWWFAVIEYRLATDCRDPSEKFLAFGWHGAVLAYALVGCSGLTITFRCCRHSAHWQGLVLTH